MKQAVATSGSRLGTIDCVGPITAVRLLGRVGHASRFRSEHAFAAYVGTAPVEIVSGERTRHRLSRSGDRRLNSTIHLIAITQVRMRTSIGRAYFDKKITEGKTRNEAMRCLKRRLANPHLAGHDRRRTQPPPTRRNRGLANTEEPTCPSNTQMSAFVV